MMTMPPAVSAPTCADSFLDILIGYGVEKIFAASGTEWAPLWEAMARRRANGETIPEYILSRHEDIAIGMASGYARLTGRLGVCLVHCSVGALRIAMGVRGAYQAQVPLLVCTGESITYGEGAEWVSFHWGRYLEDYGGPARVMETVVKSSFGVTQPALLSGSVHRACALAMAPARGPVFLSLPFEVLASPAEGRQPTRFALPRPTQPQPEVLADLAARLRKAERPLILTERLGQAPDRVADLVRLAEASGAVVVESQHPEYVNFPREHDLHGGFSANRWLEDADLILMLDLCGPPWFPETRLRPEAAYLVAIGEDPIRGRFPYHGVDADEILHADAGVVTAALADLLGVPDAAALARRAALAGPARAARQGWQDTALAQSQVTPIDSRWMCRVMAETFGEDVIFVDETILQNFTILHVMTGLKPGQFINAMDGGLGTGLGAALGVKAGAPDRPVVALIGDGAFTYNAQLAALATCIEHNLPITVVIGNNGVYRAMSMATEALYPQGQSIRDNHPFGANLSPEIDFAKLAEVVGGYGETVTAPDAIAGALRRALEANREGRPAIVNVKIDDEMKYLGPIFHPEA